MNSKQSITSAKRPFSLFYCIINILCVCLVVCLSSCGEQDVRERQKKENRESVHTTAAEKGLADSGKMQVSQNDNCSICGMPVQKHLKFATAIELADGATFYFCGTQCLIRAWLQPDVYLGVARESVRRCIVTSYFSGTHIDGKDAFFVMNSDVMGPMGPGLIALSTEKERDAFIRRHGGTSVFGIDAVSKSVLEQASGRKFKR